MLPTPYLWFSRFCPGWHPDRRESWAQLKAVWLGCGDRCRSWFRSRAPPHLCSSLSRGPAPKPPGSLIFCPSLLHYSKPFSPSFIPWLSPAVVIFSSQHLKKFPTAEKEVSRGQCPHGGSWREPLVRGTLTNTHRASDMLQGRPPPTRICCDPYARTASLFTKL